MKPFTFTFSNLAEAFIQKQLTIEDNVTYVGRNSTGSTSHQKGDS